MSKPWSEKPLWERVWLGPFSRIYLNAGKIIGHLGCGGFAFYDAAKLLPGYDKHRYENAVRDLTVYEPREQRGEYQLTATAKKVLRVILGPSPDDPEYSAWWRARLISVEQMKRDGQKVEWAEAPPVPLKPQEQPPAQEEKPKKTTTTPRKEAAPKKKKPAKPRKKK